MSGFAYDYCIATADRTMKNQVNGILKTGGFQCSGQASSAPLFLRTLRLVQPWLAVVDTSLPPGNIEELASILENDGLAAALYINTGQQGQLAQMQLQWPVSSPVLLAVAEALCREFALKKRLHKKVTHLEKKLLERRTVEKAKSVLMAHLGIGEEDAYGLLRKESMNRRVDMGEMATLAIRNPSLFRAQGPRQ